MQIDTLAEQVLYAKSGLMFLSDTICKKACDVGNIHKQTSMYINILTCVN